MRVHGRTLATLAFIVGSAGCGGGGATNPTHMASQAVGASGGTVALSDGAKLVIPAGALSSMQTITVSSRDAIPSGYVGASALYTFGPDGLQFDAPVAVTLPFHTGAKNPAV